MKRKNKIERILEIPQEVYSQIPKITIIGFEEIIIENFKGIIEYEEFFTAISTHIGVLNISGNKLDLKEMTNDNIRITGKIDKMEFDEIQDE